MLTTVGKTFSTATTAGSVAGSIGVGLVFPKTVVATARKAPPSSKRRPLGDLGESKELGVLPAFFPALRRAKRLQPRVTSPFRRKTSSPSRFTCLRKSERV